MSILMYLIIILAIIITLFGLHAIVNLLKFILGTVPLDADGYALLLL